MKKDTEPAETDWVRRFIAVSRALREGRPTYALAMAKSVLLTEARENLAGHEL